MINTFNSNITPSLYKMALFCLLNVEEYQSSIKGPLLIINTCFLGDLKPDGLQMFHLLQDLKFYLFWWLRHFCFLPCLFSWVLETSIGLHISDCHVSWMFFQIHHLRKRIHVFHPPSTHTQPCLSASQKMAEDVGVPLTLFFVSDPMSFLLGSPVNSPFKISHASDHCYQPDTILDHLSPKYCLPAAPQAPHLFLHIRAWGIFLKYILDPSLISQNLPMVSHHT